MFEIVSLVLKVIATSQPTSPLRQAFMETFSMLCSMPELLMACHGVYLKKDEDLVDQGSSVGSNPAQYIILEYLSTLHKFITEVAETPEQEIRKSFSATNGKVVKYIESQTTDVDGCVLNPFVLYKYTCEAMFGLTDSFCFIFDKCGVKLGVLNEIGDNGNAAQIVKVFNVTWKPVVKDIRTILPKHLDESFTQQLLVTMQKWINMAGSIKNTQARDSILHALCKEVCHPSKLLFHL